MNKLITCYFRRSGNTISIGNSLIERTWDICEHGLRSVALINKSLGNICKSEVAIPSFHYEGLTFNKYRENSFLQFALQEITQLSNMDSLYSVPNLEVVAYFLDEIHGIEIKNHIIVYEDTPVIKTYTEIKSVNFPSGEFFNDERINCFDIVPVPQDAKFDSREFFTRTDFTNDLIMLKKEAIDFDKGNILFSDNLNDKMFILKESPCFTDQRKECKGNFWIDKGYIKVLGTGIRPEEISDSKFRRTYACITGVFSNGFDEGIRALKLTQKNLYLMEISKNCMLVANPWGDRNCPNAICEEFVINELEVCHKMGITHYQIDDGWQKGKSFKRMNRNENIESDYWDIDPTKFPKGFSPIVELAKSFEIILSLWFAPNFNKLYEEIDAETAVLKKMHDAYGISIFKIDGVKLRNKDTEERIEYMFRKLRDISNGEIYFNLDLTADPRSGYFMFLEYGILFLENRYTDWGNYYPTLTLKNLWDLSLFIPTKRLQIEFLNLSRNPDKYDEKGDFQPPSDYSTEFAFAITMFANPLAWCEVSRLDEKSLASYSSMIALYKRHSDEIANGDIFPIGNRPDGNTFTGFQSHNHLSECGFIIVYKENALESEFTFNLHFLDEKALNLEQIYPVSDCTYDPELTCSFTGISENGKNLTKLKVNIKDKNSFILLKYAIKD